MADPSSAVRAPPRQKKKGEAELTSLGHAAAHNHDQLLKTVPEPTEARPKPKKAKRGFGSGDDNFSRSGHARAPRKLGRHRQATAAATRKTQHPAAGTRTAMVASTRSAAAATGPSVLAPLKIATVQLQMVDGDKATNLASIARLTGIARAQGASVATFPEMVITGYTHTKNLSRDELWGLAEPVPEGPSTIALIALATRLNMAILAGLVEKDVDTGKIFNTCASSPM